MRKIALLPLLAVTLLIGACNTIAGVGRDVEAAGGAVAGAANDAKN